MKEGFSLVELSIVLVILGLLTGGILAGQSLIRAAELRSVSTDYSRYTTALLAFRDRYRAIPGDMANATSFWGSSASCPGTAGTGTQTCNGDGNGQMVVAPAISQYGEEFMFWQHMANAGLIEGSYTGMAGSGGLYHGVAGTNVPRSKISTGAWYIHIFGTMTIASTAYFEGEYNNSFYFGGERSNGVPNLALLRPEEAWNIDIKLDDGKPGTGLIRLSETQTTCHDQAASAATALAAVAAYNLTNTSVDCWLIFANIF